MPKSQFICVGGERMKIVDCGATATKKNIVLFVDDELHILSAIRRAVVDEPFVSLFANSGKEALTFFENHEVSVLVTDMRMPGMDGLALLKAVREISPKTIRIVLSGYTQLSQVLVTVNQAEIFQFISKPWKMEEELLLIVRRGIERYNLEAERNSLRDGLEQKNHAVMNILRKMEQKLANEKKDIASVKHLNHWMFAFWKRHFAANVGRISEDNDDNVRDIELIETIHLAYLSILPTSFEGKIISQAVEELERACADRLSMKTFREPDPVIWGYFDVVTMIVKIIVFLHELDATQKTELILTKGKETEDTLTLVFEGKPSDAARLDQSRLKIGYALLYEIGRHYNIRLEPIRSGGGIEGLQMHWQGMLVNRVATGADSAE